MIEWWNALSFATQVFYCIAIPATMVLVIQTVLMFLGFSEEGDGADDIDIDDDVMFDDSSFSDAQEAFGLEGLRIFTIRGIIAFFVVFGWVGIVMDTAGVKLLWTMITATLCGFAMMVLLAFMFKSLMKLRSDGNADNRNAIGTSGSVHLTIPPARMGEGKVHIMLQGSYVERSAVTDSEQPIPTGCEVVVVGLSGQTELIVRRK
jgi:membrane protein implicated in regulation of membrane protease activity